MTVAAFTPTIIGAGHHADQHPDHVPDAKDFYTVYESGFVVATSLQDAFSFYLYNYFTPHFYDLVRLAWNLQPTGELTADYDITASYIYDSGFDSWLQTCTEAGTLTLS